MQRREDNVAARLNGNSLQPLSGVSVTVTDDHTGLPASLYSDNGVTALAQPLTTDDNGYYGYYAANGEYTETLTGARIAPITRKVVLADPDDNPAATLAQLAAGSGAALVKHGTETVASELDALQLADYTTLRAYAGARKSVYVTGYLGSAAPSGIAGMFVRDDADTTTADNGGTVIVATNGKRWKRKIEGAVNVLWFGADPSYATDATNAFQQAVLFGSWNGTTIYVPNGTYRIEGTIYIGTFNATQNCYSVTLVGESTHGSVLMRPPGTGSGPLLTVSGFHNVIEKLTLISEVSGAAYSASHGIYIRGNPQAGTNGNGTKECVFRNLKIYRVGVGIQLGDYDVDGKDPDIETNAFHAVEISNCNKGVFINGQNILHNPFYNCHIVDCRDYLVHQKRGGDCWFERSYFGGMFDYLTSNYNVAATAKLFVEAGVTAMIGCRSEDWASTTGNATPRYALNVTSTDSKTIYLAGNTFTTRDNLTTEPSVKLSGQGSGGAASVKAALLHNVFTGYVELNTLDVFSFGNTYSGIASGGNGVVNGRLLSTNQKTQVFRDVFMDSNQEQEFNASKFKRNSSAAVKLERAVVANASEWQGHHYYDEAGLIWARTGVRVTNATAGKEGAALLLAARMNGAFLQMQVGMAPAAPATGIWNANDRIFTTAAAVGAPKGWINTVTGGASSATRADAVAYALSVWVKWPTGSTVWECTTAGTSTTGVPDITGKTVGQTVTDGTAVWTMRSTTQANFVSEGNL